MEKRKPGRPATKRPDQNKVAEAADAGTVESVVRPDASVEIMHDPWSDKNFLKFKSHPPGFVLRWVNPTARQREGWRGWRPVEWDSELGQNLDEYLFSPPFRLEGMHKSDNYVRMGSDLVLAMLPANVFAARRAAKQEDRDRVMRSISDDLVDQDAPTPEPKYKEVTVKSAKASEVPIIRL